MQPSSFKCLRGDRFCQQGFRDGSKQAIWACNAGTCIWFGIVDRVLHRNFIITPWWRNAEVWSLSVLLQPLPCSTPFQLLAHKYWYHSTYSRCTWAHSWHDCNTYKALLICKLCLQVLGVNVWWPILIGLLQVDLWKAWTNTSQITYSPTMPTHMLKYLVSPHFFVESHVNLMPLYDSSDDVAHMKHVLTCPRWC